MSEKESKNDHSSKEMRRRWRAVLEGGHLAALGSEGRLMASYVQYWADFSSCEVRFSMRYAARYLGVQVTTVRRGVSQLIAAGILGVVEASEGSGRTRYVVLERAQGVCAPPDTLRARERTQGVRAPDTLRARSEHEACAQRTQPVRAVGTLCARNKFISIGSPKRTNGECSAETAGAGRKPAPPLREHRRLRDDSGEGTPAGDQATAADS